MDGSGETKGLGSCGRGNECCDILERLLVNELLSMETWEEGCTKMLDLIMDTSFGRLCLVAGGNSRTPWLSLGTRRAAVSG